MSRASHRPTPMYWDPVRKALATLFGRCGKYCEEGTMTTIESAATERVVEHLDSALDALLAARVLLGMREVEVPVEALDAIMLRDSGHQVARRQFAEALERLLNLLPSTGPARKQVLLMEETVNALVSEATVVVWRLGLMTRRENEDR